MANTPFRWYHIFGFLVYLVFISGLIVFGMYVILRLVQRG